MTPLYDVMSAYPLLGEGPGRLSPHKVRLAMAVRSKKPQWKMQEVRRQHWIETGRHHGVIGNAGKTEAILDDWVACTPEIVEAVRARLPTDFPQALAESILGGLKRTALNLAS